MKGIILYFLAYVTMAHGGLLSFLTNFAGGGGGGPQQNIGHGGPGGFIGGPGNGPFGPGGFRNGPIGHGGPIIHNGPNIFPGGPNGPSKQFQVYRKGGPSYGGYGGPHINSINGGGFDSNVKTLKIIHEGVNSGGRFSGDYGGSIGNNVKTIKIIRDGSGYSGGGYNNYQGVNNNGGSYNLQNSGFGGGAAHTHISQPIKTVHIVRENNQFGDNSGGHSSVKTLQILHENGNAAGGYNSQLGGGYSGNQLGGGAGESVKTLQILHDGGSSGGYSSNGYSSGSLGGQVKTLQIVHEGNNNGYSGSNNGYSGSNLDNRYSGNGGLGNEDIKTLQILNDGGNSNPSYSSGLPEKTIQVIHEPTQNNIGYQGSSHNGGHEDIKTFQLIHENSSGNLGNYNSAGQYLPASSELNSSEGGFQASSGPPTWGK